MARPLTVMQLLPALESGGVERSTIETAQGLVAAGHRALVVSAPGRLVADLEAAGGEHLPLAIGRKHPLSLRHVSGLRRLIRQHRPDVVHARSRLPAWIGWRALRGLPVAERPFFVTTVHGLHSVSRYSAIMTRGERVICVSRSVREYVLREYPATDPARLRVIERGIEPADWPRKHQPEPGWHADFLKQHPQLAGRPWFVLPGRGTRLKGHVQAIRLLAGLHRDGQPAGLLLQGVIEPGRERYVAELRAEVKQAGLDDFVAFAPPRRDIREVMAASFAVLQLSTRPEAFGRTVAEALSLGRPVLGWDRGGTGELLARGFPAGAVPPEDADALLQRAAGWLAQPPVVEPFFPFTLTQMQAAVIEVYRELCDAD